MSRLSLDGRRVGLLRTTMDVLVSPLEFEDVDAWRGQATRAVRELLDADRAFFSLPGSGTTLMYSDEYGQDVFELYLDRYERIDPGRRRLIEAGRQVYCKEQIYAGGLSPREARDYAEYHGEFLAPLKIRDSIGMVAGTSPDGLVALGVHNERVGEPGSGEHGMQIFRLLLPAFRAGVQIWRSAFRHRERFGALVDELREPVALLDPDGRCLHRNRELRKLLRKGPADAGIEERIRAAALAAGARAGMDPAATADPPPPCERFAVAGQVYELHAALLDRPTGLERGVVMVSVRAANGPPAPGEIRDRFGLTRREATVARLLWRRKSNREIAEDLVISPHTARHHTESVLAKLGIRSRRDVRRVLDGD